MKQSRLVLTATEYKKLCGRVFSRDNWRCRHCKYRNDLHAHHIIFRSQQGDDADWNLIALCNECHSNGVHRRNLVILGPSGGAREIVNANQPVKFKRLNGWVPRH